MSKVYFHVDLNAFFANAEVLLDPSLKGKPIAVCNDTRRSVVSTASYEARKFGIHSAMPVAEAKAKCRDLILVSPHFHYYENLSNQFIEILKSYTKIYEQASIDECYLDVTERIRHYERPLDLAWEIQQRILKETGLSCSIGVAPNLFLAKMGSDYKKPMGITVMRIREVKDKLWPLPIGDMRGIGNKTVPILEDMGIHTIGDLATYSNTEDLRPVFGKNTNLILDRANGHDTAEIEMDTENKSMGVSETLLEDITDDEEIRGLLRTLSKRLALRLQKENKAATGIALKIRYYDFVTTERSEKQNTPISSKEEIYAEAMRIFENNYEEDPVRLLGITATGLRDVGRQQMNLFDARLKEEEKIDALLKDLNKEAGRNCFVRASSLEKAG